MRVGDLVTHKLRGVGVLIEIDEPNAYGNIHCSVFWLSERGKGTIKLSKLDPLKKDFKRIDYWEIIYEGR
jgi:hypothetical protein